MGSKENEMREKEIKRRKNSEKYLKWLLRSQTALASFLWDQGSGPFDEIKKNERKGSLGKSGMLFCDVVSFRLRKRDRGMPEIA